MVISQLKAVIVDDSILKAMDIRKSLEFSGVRDITIVRDQESLWELIYDENVQINLIVTDMHYPIMKGADADLEAGFKLIERMKAEDIFIPVIICSTINYRDNDVFGCVWYNELNDMDMEFRTLINRLKAEN